MQLEGIASGRQRHDGAILQTSRSGRDEAAPESPGGPCRSRRCRDRSTGRVEVDRERPARMQFRRHQQLVAHLELAAPVPCRRIL